jgi:hypothetical protein
MRSLRSRVPVTLLIGAVLLVSASGGLAATRTDTVSVPNAATKKASVKCPKHKRVKGFGFLTQYEIGGDTKILPTRLLRSRSSTVASGATNQSTQAGSLKTIASCGAAPQLKTSRSVEPVLAGDQKSVTARCPKGTSIQLGGFTESVDNEGRFVAINGLERESARRLKVSGLSLGTESGKLGAYAYCAKSSPAVHAVEKTANLADEEQRTVVARCPKGQKLLMGGFEVQHYEAGDGDIYVVGMKPAGKRGWAVTGQKVLPISGKLTSIAYCH